jgi:hypothetical protein
VTASVPCAILMEYAADQWHSRIVTGVAVAAVERWLADIEARTRLPGRASGKPLMWIHLADCSEPVSQKISASRSVGILTDVLRALDRSLSVEDVNRLRAIFDSDGQPFNGAVDFA